MAVAVLEQYCSLSIVDAELRLDAMVIKPGGEGLVIRRVNSPIAVPTSLVNTGMKYVAAVLEGNTSITVQMLVTMAQGKRREASIPRCSTRSPTVEPELKVALWFPAGPRLRLKATGGRCALLDVERPLYLNLSAQESGRDGLLDGGGGCGRWRGDRHDLGSALAGGAACGEVELAALFRSAGGG